MGTMEDNTTKDKKKKGRQQTIISIPSNTMSTWRRLLTSQDHSDLSFVCPDGKVPAHKCVLSAATPYFRAALQEGRWKEGSCGENNNEWKTVHSTRIIQGILTFIYTGELLDDEDRWNGSTTSLIQLLSVASEYQLDVLVSLIED